MEITSEFPINQLDRHKKSSKLSGNLFDSVNFNSKLK